MKHIYVQWLGNLYDMYNGKRTCPFILILPKLGGIERQPSFQLNNECIDAGSW